MKVSASHAYDCSAEAVFATFADADYLQAKHEALGARNIVIERCDAGDDSLETRLRREMPADVPGVLKKFLSPWNELVQEEHWSGNGADGYRCNFSIDIKGVPVTLKGKMHLHDTGSGSVNEVNLDIDCGIPLVGKKLAQFIGADAEKAMQAEYDYIRNNL